MTSPAEISPSTLLASLRRAHSLRTAFSGVALTDL